MDWLTPTLVLVFALIFHELGHILFFMALGYRPTIKVHWWAFEVGSNIMWKLKMWEYRLVAGAGIMLGLGFMLMFDIPTTYYLFYIIFSSGDLLTLYATAKYQNHTTVYEAYLKKHREFIEYVQKQKFRTG